MGMAEVTDGIVTAEMDISTCPYKQSSGSLQDLLPGIFCLCFGFSPEII